MLKNIQQTGTEEGLIPRLPTPSTCTVCCELLLDYEDDASPELRPIVAIKCGHLFHTSCINGWFQTCSCLEDPKLRQCPFCRRLMRQCDIKRIFTVNMGHIQRSTDDRAFRPAPSTCTICWDNVLEHVFREDHSSPNLRPIVATKCGHLFHTSCLNQWFDSTTGEDPHLKSCPYCTREMRRWDIQRIFPVSSGEE